MADLWRQRISADLAVTISDDMGIWLIAGRGKRVQVDPGELMAALAAAAQQREDYAAAMGGRP